LNYSDLALYTILTFVETLDGFTETIEYDFTNKFGGPVAQITASVLNGSVFFAKV